MVSTVSVSEGVSAGDVVSVELVAGVADPDASKVTREVGTGAATLTDVFM